MTKVEILLEGTSVQDVPAAKGAVVETDDVTARNLALKGKVRIVPEKFTDQIENRESDLKDKKKTRS